MEDKYYHPEIEEFRIGFEYEIFHEGEWKKTFVPNHSIGKDIIIEIKDLGHWSEKQKPRGQGFDFPRCY